MLPEALAVVTGGWRRYGADAVARVARLRAIMDVGGGFPGPELDYEACFASGIRVLGSAWAFGPMVAEMALHDDDAACFIFEEVPGTIAGSRVLVNFFGGKRKNMTLGFPTELSKIELSEGFRTHFMGPMKRIAPRYVNDGPIFENVITGADVDLTAFPAPQWHEPDGGRYEIFHVRAAG